MNREFRSVSRTPIAIGISLAFASISSTAIAQDASSKASEGTKLQEVVITSQKRTEFLKDTPVSASVMNTEILEKANATDISDINNLVPSVQLKGTYNGRVPYSMRGISTSANEAAIGLTSGVSILIDGVPVPSDSTAANDLQDVRNVEVLKGPQSTLGGRTASAGVINFITNAPSRDFEGKIGLTATDDKETRANVFLTGPISDILSFSLSAYDYKRQYLVYNTLLKENSKSQGQGARIKLMLSPDKDTDVTLTARSATSSSTGETFTYQYLTPGAELFPYFPWNAGHGVSQAVALPGITPIYGNVEYASPVNMFSKTSDRDLSLNIERRVGDYTFTSTTASMKNSQDIVQDVPAVATYFLNDLRGPIPGPTAGGPPLFMNTQPIQVTPNSLTQEFKISSPLNQPVSYVAGLFYSNVDVASDTARVMFVNPLINSITSNSKSLGLYGRTTWNLSNATSVLTGLRFNRDDIRYEIQDHALGFTSANSDVSDTMVGDLTVRQKLDKDQMIYGTYSRGYKPRAFNTAALLTGNGPLSPAEKETINHFEVGAKTKLAGGSIQLNTALFSTDYQNYQVQIFDNTGGGYINNLVLSNAGRAHTNGLELDGQAALAANTKLTFSAAYIDAKFISYPGAPCYPGQTTAQGCTVNAAGVGTQDLSGTNMPDSSKFKYVLGLDHQFAQSMIPWDLRFNAQYSYRTEANMQADQNPRTKQDGYGILNLNLTTSSPDGKYSASLFVNNALNQFYLVNIEDFFSGLWGTNNNAVIGQPARDARRYLGVRFNVEF